MMAGKEFVFRQVKVRGVGSANQESVMLIESELASRIGPSQNS
jgi:hypothetical protein